MQLDYFTLIDRIVNLDFDGKTIIVEAEVPEHHTIFEGHFPGFPIMPGVLLTEAMAQSSGWLLTGEAKIEHEGSGFAVTSAKARVGTELKCSADLTFRLIPFPDPAFRGHIDAMARKLGFPLQAIEP